MIKVRGPTPPTLEFPRMFHNYPKEKHLCHMVTDSHRNAISSSFTVFPLSTVFSSYLGLSPDFCVLFMDYYGYIPFLKQLCLPLLHVYEKQWLHTDDLLE